MSKLHLKSVAFLSLALVGASAFAAGGNLIQNGGFEDSTVIWNNSGNYGSNGPDGRTAVWTGGQICKANTTLQPPSGFIVGTYCGYLWGASSLSQEFVFPVDGACRVEFKAVQRNGQNTPHPIKVILTRLDTGVAVTNEFTVSSKVAAGDSYQHDFENVSAGPYKLTILGTNINGASCYENVSVTAVSETVPFASISFVQDCGTRVSLKVRSFGGPNDEAITVDYALSADGTTWTEWTSVSSSLAKGLSASAVIEQLQLETAYRLKLRLTAGGSEQTAVIPFTTSKELLRNRGFEGNSITVATGDSATKNVSDAAPWQGSGSVANKGYKGLEPKAAVVSGGFHAYCWCNANISQEAYVPVPGTYHLQFNYVLRNSSAKHVFALEWIKDGKTNTIETVTNTKTAKTAYGKDFSIDSAGTMTFRFRGTEAWSQTTDGTSFMDEFSITLVKKESKDPIVNVTVGAKTMTSVTFDEELSATGGSAVNVQFAYGPKGGVVGAFKTIHENLSEGNYSYTQTGLDYATEYEGQFRFVNEDGYSLTLTNTFSTSADCFVNGGFENGSSIEAGKTYGSLMSGEAATEGWTASGAAAGLSSVENGGIKPSPGVASGTYMGYIWENSSLSQKMTVPARGLYKLSFKYGRRNQFCNTNVNVIASVANKYGVVTNLLTTTLTDATARSFTSDPFELPKGKATVSVAQVNHDSGSGACACYDDFKLELVERLNPPGLAIIIR